MDPFASIAPNLGLTALTALAIALSGYLVYSMLHPERF
jgi:K+-transporting ATPase KdpF subunit